VNVVLNGAETQIADDATIAELLRTLDVPPEGRGVAVAIDAEVVPRGQWERTHIHDGARVEVVHAVQGG
jgi:sulfur carrier protein